MSANKQLRQSIGGRPPSGSIMPTRESTNALKSSSSQPSERRNRGSSIQEQLILIQMDIEDRGKVCSLLQSKIDQQRIELESIERDMREHYQHTIEVELLEHKSNSDRFVEFSNQLMAEKEELLTTCKDLIESIQDKDKLLASEIRGIYHQAEQEIATLRNSFKIGYEERLSKFLSEKTAEYKEQISKALQPEMKRLSLLHENDVADVDLQGSAAEREARNASARRLQQESELLREEGQDAMRAALRAQSDHLTQELERCRSEHEQATARQQAAADREHERLRVTLSERTAATQRQLHRELKELQEGGQRRLLELKGGHLQLLEGMRRDHDLQVKALLKGEDEASLDPDDSPDPRTPLQEDGSVTAEERRQWEQLRDRTLQAEILSEEAETARLERQMAQRLQQECSQAAEAARSETRHVEESLRQLKGAIADLVVSREKLLQSLADCREREASLQAEHSQLQRDLATYRDGIAAQRSRMADKKSLHQLRMKDADRLSPQDSSRRIAELSTRCERLRAELAAAERASEDELADISSGHRRELQRLDAQVKADIARLERDIEAARDEASAEQIKTSKFEKLIQQYSAASSSSSSSVRTASTASTATRSTRPPFSTTQRSSSNTRGALSSTSSGRGASKK
mmetsp:Transcript_26198/g.37494  ORF Transcript_26198/g.37494 Transcript_26198/m.37494 type:complete len:638 (+) Transcript_26198:1491-3404(+)